MRDVAAAIADEYRRAWPTSSRSRTRRVGRTLAVRGLAHPRSGGAHDDAGALRSGPEFMAELEAAGGDFTHAVRTPWRRATARSPVGTLARRVCRSDVLHGWQPPGGGLEAR